MDAHYSPRAPLPIRWFYHRPGPSRGRSQSELPLLHRSYRLMRQTKTLLRPRCYPCTSDPCRLLRAPAGSWPLSGRNTVRAALGREFPTCTLSVVQRVPSSTITHVSASPPLIPDSRISRVRLAAMAFPRHPSHLTRNLSARTHTPLG